MINKILEKLKKEIDIKYICQIISNIVTVIGVLGLIFTIGAICYVFNLGLFAIYICIILITIGYLLDQEAK